MAYFAVIDTETNWRNQVMSIGTVAVDVHGFAVAGSKYQVLTPEVTVGGMYQDAVWMEEAGEPMVCTRRQAMTELLTWFRELGIRDVFAYNANFDRNHLPELAGLRWYDIMAKAAYRQYNRALPASAEYCSTGRLKRGYGVEPMLRLLSRNRTYRESHNAILDAMDELEIMRLLGYHPGAYEVL